MLVTCDLRPTASDWATRGRGVALCGRGAGAAKEEDPERQEGPAGTVAKRAARRFRLWCGRCVCPGKEGKGAVVCGVLTAGGPVVSLAVLRVSR